MSNLSRPKFRGLFIMHERRGFILEGGRIIYLSPKPQSTIPTKHSDWTVLSRN